jgi:hypothetical protein
MASASHRMTGGCLCGAVRFVATPAKQQFDACHCGMCRRWSAGPALMVDCGTDVEFTNESGLAFYRSSDWAERGFCNRCGTSLCYRLSEQKLYFVSLEALDDRDGFAFSHQIFIDEKPAYYDFANKTRTMTGAEVFAAFAQPDSQPAKG